MKLATINDIIDLKPWDLVGITTANKKIKWFEYRRLEVTKSFLLMKQRIDNNLYVPESEEELCLLLLGMRYETL